MLHLLDQLRIQPSYSVNDYGGRETRFIMLDPYVPPRHAAAGSSLPSPRLAGRIMWLPTKDVMDLGFENGVYNHPVVILSPMSSAGEVDFFLLTSFGGTSLLDKFPTEKKARSRYLPIKPSAPHPDSNIVLELSEAQDRLAKDSYVHIGKTFRARLSILRPYMSNRLRSPYLSENSYRQLIYTAEYSVPIAVGDWTSMLPPSQITARAQGLLDGIPHGSLYGGISQPEHGQRPLSFGREGNFSRQTWYQERTALLPPPQPANPPRPSVTRRIWIDWWKVFGFFCVFLCVVVVVSAACYGVLWVVNNLAPLVSACWLWLKHGINDLEVAIENWYEKLLGHAELM